MIINKNTVNKAKEILNDQYGIGVNHGFKRSFPASLVHDFSDFSKLKDKERYNNKALIQDLGTRFGTLTAAKALAGGTVGYGLHELQQGNKTLEDLGPAFWAVPAIGSAVATSRYINNKIPELHRKIFGTSSIYRDPNKEISINELKQKIPVSSDKNNTLYKTGRGVGTFLGDTIAGSLLGAGAGYLQDPTLEGAAKGLSIGTLGGAGLGAGRAYYDFKNNNFIPKTQKDILYPKN